MRGWRRSQHSKRPRLRKVLRRRSDFAARARPDTSKTPLGSGYLRIAAAGYDSPLALPARLNGAAQNVDFGKGTFVLDMLAREVGRNGFHAFLRSYFAAQRRKEFSDFSWPSFFAALSRATGRNMSYFYDEWFRRQGAPQWNLSWKRRGNAIEGALRQRGPIYRLRVPLEAIDQRGRVYRRALLVSQRTTRFAWRLPTAPVELRDDPRYTILHWTPEYRALATAVIPFTRWGYKPYDGVEADLARSLARVDRGDRYGLRFAVEYAWGRIEIRKSNWHKRNA